MKNVGHGRGPAGAAGAGAAGAGAAGAGAAATVAVDATGAPSGAVVAGSEAAGGAAVGAVAATVVEGAAVVAGSVAGVGTGAGGQPAGRRQERRPGSRTRPPPAELAIKTTAPAANTLVRAARAARSIASRLTRYGRERTWGGLRGHGTRL